MRTDYHIGQEIEVSLPGEAPFRARVWRAHNTLANTVWYERENGEVDFAGGEYVRTVAESVADAEAKAERTNWLREVERENEMIRREFPDGIARVRGPKR